MNSSGSFSGLRYAILGGSGGIGSAVAQRLANQGATLSVASRDTSAYSDYSWASSAEVSEVDARQADEVTDWIAGLSGEHDVHGVINAVGSIELKPLTATSQETWERTIELNLTSCFSLLKGYIDNRPESGGQFVAFSSAAAGRGLPNHEAISAAKAGVEGLIRSVAATYASDQFRANCVSPGLVETDLSESILRSDRARKQSESMHALGEIGEPDDVAKAVLWLLDPDNDWVTGQVIGVDGGLRTLFPKS